MEQASRTAFGAALHRAAHQIVDDPPVFADPLALKIIGEEAARDLREGKDRHALLEAAPLRAFIAARSRYAEDCLAEAVERGVSQYVLLGAGFDTFAYRAPHNRLAIYEVDHPATQGWKRERLRNARIASPGELTYAPVDFECETLREGLARAGFGFARPAFFAWLGVTPYLSREAIAATLGFVASLAKGSEIVFDYAEPRSESDPNHRAFLEKLATRVAEAGEPFLSFFRPEELATLVRGLGFSHVRDMDAAALNARYFAGRGDGLRLRGSGHLMRARV